MADKWLETSQFLCNCPFLLEGYHVVNETVLLYATALQDFYWWKPLLLVEAAVSRITSGHAKHHTEWISTGEIWGHTIP